MPMYPYCPAVEEVADIENRFTYHPPKEGQAERYQDLRDQCKDLALNILGCCPPGRERALALTKLEEASFWANAAIARNE